MCNIIKKKIFTDLNTYNKYKKRKGALLYQATLYRGLNIPYPLHMISIRINISQL